MAPSKNNQVLFERRRKEHNIVFVEDLKQCHRPAKHAKVFESIDRIKEISYQSYACEDSEQEPWKKEAKSQARKLAEKAHDCIARNEPTWRLACEPLVFSRLTSEVAWYVFAIKQTIMGSLSTARTAAGGSGARKSKQCWIRRTAQPSDSGRGSRPAIGFAVLEIVDRRMSKLELAVTLERTYICTEMKESG